MPEANQHGNAVKVLTSGVERRAEVPFYSSHKWRFVVRIVWWDGYREDTPVLFGRYWRRLVASDRSAVGNGDKDLFHAIDSMAWPGVRKNVFCLDFSVGARWQERRSQTAPGT